MKESEEERDGEEHSWVPHVSSQEPDLADDYLPDYLKRLVLYSHGMPVRVKDGAGLVQLATLGTLLQHLGVTMWDLGMVTDYKEHLGAIEMPRPEFVAHVHRVRVSHSVSLILTYYCTLTIFRPQTINPTAKALSPLDQQQQHLTHKNNHWQPHIFIQELAQRVLTFHLKKSSFIRRERV
eukprot:scaffold5776_cov53-Attheya_sp.AAC.2